MAGRKESTKGLNILCFDDGGAYGLSSLIVLREFMHRINYGRRCGEKPLEPHEHFDMIAGTGTGGISACMLGRLRMPIDKAIEEYVKVMQGGFSRKRISGSTVYKGTRLQDVLKAMIRDTIGNEQEMLIDGGENGGCKTAVIAMAKHHLNAGVPVMFRSYQVAANPGPLCMVWQAMYATIAHPDLFKSIKIVDSSVPQWFVGGQFGCSNPLIHVLSEASRLYPEHGVACIISIGAGFSRTIQVPNPVWWKLGLCMQDVAVAKNMVTDGERVAEEMASRFQGTTGVYFRFKADQGEGDIRDRNLRQKSLSEVVEHAEAYLRKNEVHQRMENAVRNSLVRRGNIATIYAAGRIPGYGYAPQIMKFKHCPPPTAMYTGREDEILQLVKCITGSNDGHRVCVVYGLGGTGKTQLVLKVIERTWDKWRYIIYVDASSKEAAEGTLGEFAKAKGIGNTYNDTIGWLQTCREHWLIVFDSVGTSLTNVRWYIPGGSYSRVLITTRLPDLVGISKGPGAVCYLSGMSEMDGLVLLLRTTRSQDHDFSRGDQEAALALLKDFGYLALAIVQAGAYIAHSPGMTFLNYRRLFLSERRRMLEQYTELPAAARLDEYGETVYTTWRMCYDQLKPQSRMILWIISYWHNTQILEDIFKKAVGNIHSHFHPLPLTELESQARTYVGRFLSDFLDAHNTWDTVKFTSVMADLRSHSLIDYDRLSATYTMHILVQDWARTIIPLTPELAIECSAWLISLSIDFKKDTASLAFTRRLGPHVISLLQHGARIGTNHSYYFIHVLGCIGQWDRQEKQELKVLEAFQHELGEYHPLTLESMTHLSSVYSYLGRWKEAEHIDLQALERHKHLLGEEHPETLTCVANLAATYSRLGRWGEAERLHIRALSGRKRLMGEEHPATLNSMAHLALTYSDMSRWNEAARLRLKVLEVRSRVLGGEHPKTLRSMSSLASTYAHLGRWDDAVSLLTKASAISQLCMGADHPNTREYLQRLEYAQKSLIWRPTARMQ